MTKAALKSRPRRSPRASTRAGMLAEIYDDLRLANLFCEKCELKRAEDTFNQALSDAKELGDLRATMEAISGLLRISGEELDAVGTERWTIELDRLMAEHPRQIPPLAWYCKGAIAKCQRQYALAQRYFHRYLRAVRREEDAPAEFRLHTREESEARAWTVLAVTLFLRGHTRRARFLADKILKEYETRRPRGALGSIYILLSRMAEARRDYPEAMAWNQKAHVSILSEHNWFSYPYVLIGYARIARLTRNYSQAYWYLDLAEKATQGSGFEVIRKEIAQQRTRLEQDAVDLLIDCRQGVVRTRDAGAISLRKQYVLLNILEALSGAHQAAPADDGRGLSKAEIIQRVWNENYRPEAHDNKLYYNINRLRKLIEPDVRKPQYLLNWREGYRLAPGLRVQVVGKSSEGKRSETTQGEGNQS